MKKMWKKTTAAVIVTSMSAGCAHTFSAVPAASSEISAETAETPSSPAPAGSFEPLNMDVSPSKLDRTKMQEPEYYDDQAYINGDAVATDLSFAETVSEIPYAYYDPADEQGTLSYFNYETYDYNGDGAEEEKYAVVYTPYGYNEDTSYDIMYLMHGVSGYAEIYLGYPGEETSIKNCIDHLIEEGRIKPMIIVCMTYYDNNIEEINENEDSDLIGSFYNEFNDDLMPAVESAYSTYAKTADAAGLTASRDHRIFAGFSMGGVTTWYAFMNSMAYCRYYMPMSGMLYWGPDASKNGRDADEWAGQFLASALAAEGYTRDDFYLYIATGGYDEAKPLLEDQVKSMEMESSIFTFGPSTDSDANCTYAYSEYEAHSWQAVFTYLYNALPVFSEKISGRSTE
jgi:enterochelin esterase-like enzyme